MVPIPVAAVLEPTPAPVMIAELPACTAENLTLRFNGENGAFGGMQHGGTLMVVRNVGAEPCRVPALPRVTFAGPGGERLPIRFAPPSGMHPGPAVPPVGIAPRAEVTADLRWVSGDAFPGGRCYRAHAVRAAFGAALTEGPLEARLCGPAAGAIFSQTWLKPDAPLRK